VRENQIRSYIFIPIALFYYTRYLCYIFCTDRIFEFTNRIMKKNFIHIIVVLVKLEWLNVR